MSKILGDFERWGSDDEPLDTDLYDRGDRSEAAAFIAEASCELSKMAKRHGLDMLRHLLDMTQLEASEILRSKRKLS